MTRRRAMIGILILAASVAGCGGEARPAATGTPRLEVSPRVDLDLGTVKTRSETRVAWRLRNWGTGELRVTLDRTSCNCTNPTPRVGETWTLAPGESREVSATMVATGWGGGTYERVLHLTTNDPASPEVNLSGKFHEEPAFRGKLHPAAHAPGLKDPGQFRVESVFYAPSKKDFAILKATPTSPKMLVEFDRISTEEASDAAEMAFPAGYAAWRVRVRLKDDFPRGQFKHAVTLLTNLDEVPELTLAYSGIFREPWVKRSMPPQAKVGDEPAKPAQ